MFIYSGNVLDFSAVTLVCLAFCLCGRLALDDDNLCMMKEAEGAQDPFFGLMVRVNCSTPVKYSRASHDVGWYGPGPCPVNLRFMSNSYSVNASRLSGFCQQQQKDR